MIWILLGVLFLLAALYSARLRLSAIYTRLRRMIFQCPFLGDTLWFLQHHPTNSLGGYLQDRCSRYGKVFKSHVFLSPTIISCDHDLSHFILSNEGRYFQGTCTRTVHGVLGKKSLLVVVGDTHKRLKTKFLAMVAAIMSSPDFFRDIESLAEDTMMVWRGKKQIFFSEEARKFTFSVIVKQFLGDKLSQAQTTELHRDIQTVIKGLFSVPICIPGLSYANAIKARYKLSSTVKDMLKEREVSRQNSHMREREDVLDVLLLSDGLSDEERVSLVLDALLGGYETTTHLLTQAVHFLGQCLPAVDHLLLEHRKINAKKNQNWALSLEDYKNMEFTKKVINETLRCGNIVKFVHRVALQDVRFKGYLIPSGCKVIPVLSATHLEPSLHAEASIFNPWTWEAIL